MRCLFILHDLIVGESSLFLLLGAPIRLQRMASKRRFLPSFLPRHRFCPRLLYSTYNPTFSLCLSNHPTNFCGHQQPTTKRAWSGLPSKEDNRRAVARGNVKRYMRNRPAKSGDCRETKSDALWFPLRWGAEIPVSADVIAIDEIVCSAVCVDRIMFDCLSRF